MFCREWGTFLRKLVVFFLLLKFRLFTSCGQVKLSELHWVTAHVVKCPFFPILILHGCVSVPISPIAELPFSAGLCARYPSRFHLISLLHISASPSSPPPPPVRAPGVGPASDEGSASHWRLKLHPLESAHPLRHRRLGQRRRRPPLHTPGRQPTGRARAATGSDRRQSSLLSSGNRIQRECIGPLRFQVSQSSPYPVFCLERHHFATHFAVPLSTVQGLN